MMTRMIAAMTIAMTMGFTSLLPHEGGGAPDLDDSDALARFEHVRGLVGPRGPHFAVYLDEPVVEVDALQHEGRRALDRLDAHRRRLRARVHESLDDRAHHEQRPDRHDQEREELHPEIAADRA